MTLSSQHGARVRVEGPRRKDGKRGEKTEQGRRGGEWEFVDY